MVKTGASSVSSCGTGGFIHYLDKFVLSHDPENSGIFKKNIYGVKELKQRPFFGYLYYSDKNILSPTYGLNIFYKKITSSNIGYIFEGESMFATPDEDNQIPAIFLNKKENGIVKIMAIIPNKTYKNLQSNVLIKTAEIKVGQRIPEK